MEVARLALLKQGLMNDANAANPGVVVQNLDQDLAALGIAGVAGDELLKAGLLAAQQAVRRATVRAWLLDGNKLGFPNDGIVPNLDIHVSQDAGGRITDIRFLLPGVNAFSWPHV